MEREAGTEGPFPHGQGTLLIDGEPAGTMETDRIFWLMISWSGLDVGFDRGTTCLGLRRQRPPFIGPFEFSGELEKVTVDLDADQAVDHERAGTTELARE